MNHTIQELSFQEQPIHIFEYDGKIAFLAQEVGQVLDIQNVSRTIQRSKALETGIDYDVIPSNNLDLTTKKVVRLPGDAPKVTILYLSGFFLFVLRSNSLLAAPFTRWAIREAIPQAFVKRQAPELSEKTLVQLVKEERQGSGIARQMLSVHGWIDPMANQQLSFSDSFNGGSHE